VRAASPTPVGTLTGAPGFAANVTLCGTPEIVHVTTPPTAMSTDAGENDRPGVETAAAAGNTGAFTVIVSNADTVVLPRVASALTLAVPAETPVTSPEFEPTVATAGAFDDQVTVAPAIGVPSWSIGLAVSCRVEPTATAEDGDVIVTDVSTGAAGFTVTVRVAVIVVPLRLAAALTTAEPTAAPVTRPDGDTAAIAAADELQATLAATGFPFWSTGAALSCRVPPTSTTAADGEIDTLVSTGAAVWTVTVALIETVSEPDAAVAVMVVVPTAFAVTTPEGDTVATAAAADDHVTVAATGLPFWSSGLAVSCSVWPTATVPAPVSTTLVSTGAAATTSVTDAAVEAEPPVAVAEMAAVPGPTAVTRPSGDTVATVLADVAQDTDAAMGLPAWSRATAAS